MRWSASGRWLLSLYIRLFLLLLLFQIMLICLYLLLLIKLLNFPLLLLFLHLTLLLHLHHSHQLLPCLHLHIPVFFSRSFQLCLCFYHHTYPCPSSPLVFSLHQLVLLHLPIFSPEPYFFNCPYSCKSILLCLLLFSNPLHLL